MSINATLAEQLHTLFDTPDPREVPSGVLVWFGDTTFPDGREPTGLSPQQWQMYYSRLETGALMPDVLPASTALARLSNTFPADGPVPIAIANVALSVPTTDFSKKVEAAAAAGKGLDPAPDGLSSVIENAHAFMAAGILAPQFNKPVPAVRSRVVTFVVDERFYCSNPGAPLPDAIDLDLGDGSPVRSVRFGEQVTGRYPDTDEITLKITCHYGDQALHAETSLPISEDAVAPAPDETWPLYGLGSGNTGQAWVWRAPGHAEIVNPLIVCEGFPGGYPQDYVYDVLSSCGTVKKLQERGYDLIIIGLANGADRMQNNADVVVACIQEALGKVAKTNGAENPLVVGGVSMGGLVTRYALALMESRGQHHGTHLFFSVDSPHGGAYTSVADQWLLHYLKPSSVLAQNLSALVDSPANQQFMQYWVQGGEVIVSPMREQFLEDLEAIGSWPEKPKRIAIASGRGDGKREIPAHAKMLEWAGSEFASATLYTLPESDKPEVIGEAYCLRADPDTPPSLSTQTEYSWEGAPGGSNVYEAMTAGVARLIGVGDLQDDYPITLCIATVSALGVDASKADPFQPIPPPGSDWSPFHDYVWGKKNTHHMSLHPASSKFLLKHLGTPKPEPVPEPAPGKPKWSPDSFNPHDPEYSRNPYPIYAKMRKHSPVHWVDPYEAFWVFRHEDVMRVLTDSEVFSELNFAKNNHDVPTKPAPGPFDVLANNPQGLFFLDPPRHGEVRKPMDKFLVQAAAQAEAIAAIVSRKLLVEAKQSGRMEFYNSFALPLPSSVVLQIMGIPQQDWAGIVQWVGAVEMGHDITQPPSIQGTAATCAMALDSYYQALIRGTQTSGCPVKAGPGGLLDLMIKDGMGPMPKMSADDVAATSVNMAVAGYLSTTFLIATGLLTLLGGDPASNPDGKTDAPLPIDILREKPELIPAAVNEMLRHDSPFQLTDRYVVNHNVKLGGKQLRRGDHVSVVIGSANRDETVYPDPDVFDITRKGPPHIAFGAGIHRCYGAPIVERVAPIAFQMILQELSTIELAGAPYWQSDPYIRSVSNLPLIIA
jgi:cytochrome P450